MAVETAITGALVDQTRAVNYLQRTGASVPAEHLDRISEFINYVTGEAERYTARRLLSRAYSAAGSGVLVVDGNNCNEIRAPEYPVTGVTSIKRRLSDGTTQTLDITILRLPNEGRYIWLGRDYFTCGRANIELDIVAGYVATTHAADVKALQAAALRWIQVLYQDYDKAIGRGQSIAIGNLSISEIDTAMPKDVEAVFRRFSRLP